MREFVDILQKVDWRLRGIIGLGVSAILVMAGAWVGTIFSIGFTLWSFGSDAGPGGKRTILKTLGAILMVAFFVVAAILA